MDGSKIAGGVGLSVCILNKEIQQKTIYHRLEPNNTVLQAELAALGVAADWAVENNNKLMSSPIANPPSMPSRAIGQNQILLIQLKSSFAWRRCWLG
ncbi:hypothetical protein AVEN_259051-1 [Araneus ventricosus]|uniref:RNase H type-1 domain-containing protein n=1 Tax=Araneus ventricosus TaxID=182803 RepID=A0A4Y2KN54_ARAVE|nr:hypothetical protein AVEN_259051-1 [Araneus ventricosus]